jgi:hypothetical protein
MTKPMTIPAIATAVPNQCWFRMSFISFTSGTEVLAKASKLKPPRTIVSPI